MDEQLFNRLMESAKQAVDISEGKSTASRTFTFEAAIDVKTIRNEKLHLSQDQFAMMLGVSVRTLQDWEQGRRKPSGAAKSLLKVAAHAPETVLQALS